MITEISELVDKHRGKEQLVAIKCLDIAKKYKKKLLNRISEESTVVLGVRVIPIEKILDIFEERDK